ncbi:MAG: Transglutaminase-like superfamily protein [Gemmataceae bacterium]|nr:Transglutaminase-like superfamily protein [Gemmataceae bacterium]
MRTWFTPVLLAAVAGGFASSAQPPSDPPRIVIKPRISGDPGAPGTAQAIPKDPPGFIVIRPRSEPAAPTAPVQPAPMSPPAGPAVLQPNPVQPAAESQDGKVLFEYWFVAAVEGERIGYLSWTAREVEMGGKKVWRGTKYQRFTVARFGQVVAQVGEESTVETPDGEVLLTSMRQGLGKDQALALTGVVDGKTLKVRGEGMAKEASSSIPWPGGVTGVVGEPRLFKDQKLKPGEAFEYRTYVPQVNRVVKVTVTYEGEEATVLWPDTPPRKLRRFVSKMEPVGNFKLPAATTWCDAESAEPLRVEFDFPGLGGRVTFLRTTEDAAKAPVARPVELFKAQSIRLDREIPGIHSRVAVVYKVSVPRDDDPATAFAADARQEVRNLDAKAKTFDLHVSAVHGPVKGAKPEPAPAGEFLGSNFFINWDNPGVKGHAAKAVAGLPPGSTDWDKARAVERWVKQNMQAVDFSQAMATADNVAKTLSGDCTEYAMLGAAMCRAVGVPSRTVLGLVYAPGPGGKPFLAYHMWFEAFADGQWVPLDPTLGQGGVGPGHVKITDHSWHDEKTLAPLLPVLRVLMAKPAFEVVKVSP